MTEKEQIIQKIIDDFEKGEGWEKLDFGWKKNDITIKGEYSLTIWINDYDISITNDQQKEQLEGIYDKKNSIYWEAKELELLKSIKF